MRLSKRNLAPEKFVEREVLLWARSMGFDLDVFDSKATWSRAKNCYVSQGLPPGISDLIGNTPDGTFCAIELKAPGHLSTFNTPARLRQREYIENKIDANCFACVVDSVERLKIIYGQWELLKPQAAKTYLREMLPQKRKIDAGHP